MKHKLYNAIRQAILAAARAAGIANANQFGEVMHAAGIMSKSLAADYWRGMHDITTAKAAAVLEYFNSQS